MAMLQYRFFFSATREIQMILEDMGLLLGPLMHSGTQLVEKRVGDGLVSVGVIKLTSHRDCQLHMQEQYESLLALHSDVLQKEKF